MIDEKTAEVEAVKATFEAKKAELEANKAEFKARRDELVAKKEELEAKAAEGEDVQADIDLLKEELTKLEADRDEFVLETEAVLGEIRATQEKYEKQLAEFEKFQAEAIPQFKSQFDFVFPTRSEVSEMLKGDGTAKNRLNNNTEIFFDEENNIYQLKINMSALEDKTDKYIETATGYCYVELDATTKKPQIVQFYNASVKAQGNNNNAVGTITDTVINFAYPTETVLNAEVTEAKSLDEYITSDELADIIFKYASKMVKISD